MASASCMDHLISTVALQEPRQYTLAMVFHTFHLRFRPDTTPDQIESIIATIRGFQGHVPGLLETHIGPNFSRHSNGFTYGAAMKFTDRASLEAYLAPSPLHSELLARAVPLMAAIQEVDFEA